jgi:hypothetical protein
MTREEVLSKITINPEISFGKPFHILSPRLRERNHTVGNI